jgi:Tol biopolymer transport system component
MTPERYRRAGEIYHAALALPPERRREFLAQSCGSDLDLQSDVESLLAAHADAGQFIESPPESFAKLLQPMLDASRHDSDRSFDEEPQRTGDASLGPGQRLGHYEVIDLLGAGGMGSVYRALDLTLGREVAIKALAHTFRGDSASLRRFEREARVLATLSHPNIAAIYGLEHFDGSPYLVLERVEGQTLAGRLLRGTMPIDETFKVAEQIIAGLEEAHAKGIIHRDLKPSNVMLTPSGHVKLVDFGLAKTTGTRRGFDGSAEPITSPGVVLGTARYMSPEQVKGEAVDMRTDVWAFGCVLYEMLTARPVFAGRSVSEVVAAVLRDDPDWRAIPARVPQNVKRLLRRCLQRDVRSRLQHIGDARLELVEVDDEPAVGATGARRSLLRWSAAGAIAAAFIAGLALVLLRGPSTVSESRAARLSVEVPAGLSLVDGFSAPFAIAPTGSKIVFEAVEDATQRLYVRELSDPTLRVLSGTEGARQPFFSADGAWIGFFANRKLSKVPVNGGPVLHVADVGGNPRGGAWTPDGAIVAAAPQTSGLVRVLDSGGKPTPLTTLDKSRGESSHRWPDVLPGGKWVIFTVGFEDAPYDEARIDAVSLATGERRVLVSNAGFARYLHEGRLLFVRGGLLHVVGFDPEGLMVRGTPEVVLDPVRYDTRNGGSHVAVSRSGVLLYGPGQPVSSEYYLAWVDRDGRLTRATDTPRAFRNVKASPDGRRVATVIGRSADSDLWLVDANGTLSRLSIGLSPHHPTWTSNGSGVTVSAEKGGSWRLLTVATDGKGDPTVHFESPHRVYPNAWSPDGKHLIFQESRPDTGWDLRVLDIDATGRAAGEPRMFANTPFHETSAAISPDGRWVSYESNELDGVFHVYVRSFPDGGHRARASSGGARWPAWDRRRNLHYWRTEDDTLWVVPTMEKSGELALRPPQSIWRGPAAAAVLTRIDNPVAGARYDLEPEGTRFLVLERSTVAQSGGRSHPIIVLGWPDVAATANR